MYMCQERVSSHAALTYKLVAQGIGSFRTFSSRSQSQIFRRLNPMMLRFLDSETETLELLLLVLMSSFSLQQPSLFFSQTLVKPTWNEIIA